MCDTPYKKPKKESKEKFYANTSIITKKSFFRYIKGHPREEYNPPWPPPNSNVYPKANIYYAFNEDTNPFTRLESAFKCLDFNGPHFEPPREPYTVRDPYNDDIARRKYVGIPPTAFVIFGKPGLNSTKLASMIADSWGCVLISPEVLLKEEIAKNTDKGKYIAETLKSGGCVGPEIVMNLIESRVRMRDVMHRGYVVEGLPLIPNEILDYSSYPESDDNSQNLDTCPTKVNVKEQGLSDASLKEPSVCQDSRSSFSSAYHVPPTSVCKLATNHELEIPRQIENIFLAWPIKPTVIIYIMCPDQDLVRRREQFRFNAHTGQVVDSNVAYENNRDRDEFHMQFYRDILSKDLNLDEDQRRHVLLRIPDMKCNVQQQCQIYEKIAMPVIEKWVLTHNPQNVLRVDGRTSVFRMYEIINARLRILPIQRLFLPKLMTDRMDFEMHGEGAIVTLEDEYDDMNNQEAFEELTNRGAISTRFPWRLSTWKFFCPVELAKGKTVEGNPTHSVRFMSKLFFLSSREAADLFVENPRPFLLSTNPRPPCRIIVFGPRYSGKSEISRILAQKFGGCVIDVNEAEKCLVEDKINAKVTDAMRRIVHNVIKDLKKSLETERQRRKSLKTAEILSWFEDASVLVSEFFAVQSEPKSHDQQERLEYAQQQLRDKKLKKLVADRKLQRKVKKDMQLLYDFMPAHLKEEEPPVRDLTEHDPEVVSILESHVNHLRYETIHLTTRERAELIIDKIKMLPEEQIDTDIYRDNGFIIDGMSLDPDVWSIFTESDIVFEDIVVLWNDEPFKFLIQKWHRMRKRDECWKESERRPTDDFQEQFEGETIMSPEMIELEQYIAELRQFVFEWNSMKETMGATGKNVIICDLESVRNVSEYVEKNIRSRYELEASVMTEEEREREKIIEDMAAMEIESVKQNIAGEGAELEGNEAAEPADLRRLGDTSIYCPVALASYNLLWIGKEEFSVTYANKIYMMSTENALDEFVENPRRFNVPFDKPPFLVPQLRFCIVGSTGCGKTAIADKISKEYGLTHVDYNKCLIKFMKERRLLPPASRHSLVLLENYLDTVDLPEDLNDEKYNTDKKTVRTFIQNYVKNGGILPTMLRDEVHLHFFRPPYEQYGLIFDGFPSCEEDVQMILENYTVPEIIFELKCDPETSLERRLPDLMNTWRESQTKLKQLEEDRYREEVILNELRREIWIQKEMTKRRKQRLLDIAAEATYEDHQAVDELIYQLDSLPVKSMDSLFRAEDSEIFDPDPIQASIDREELEASWKFRTPEPELFTDWEEPVMARERISMEFQAKYETDAEKLISIKAALENETIPWIEIDAERDEQTLLIQILTILDPYIFRDTSMFERCYRVGIDNAERLLDCGYYILSSFGRWCPVQLYERKNPIPMFFIMEANEEIYPVIHRQYIYFLGGKEACTAFMKNPMKYIEQDSCVPLIPLRISIIGPPKCGKTTLAERFARTYGLKLITRGKALRHMLDNFSWTELARLTEAHLRSGHAALDESIARAVELYSIDPRSAIQGYILDGFPNNRAECEELAFLGIQPMIVIDLKANLDFCLDCLSFDDDEDSLRKPGNFTSCFLTHRYDKWYEEQKNFRDWLRRYSDNIVEVDGTLSKWYVWTRADNAVRSKYTEILRYFRRADYDSVHKLENMCVSPYEFGLHQSIFESFCPTCLFADDTMEFSEPALSRKNVVQFRRFFYWFCSRHIDEFIQNPLDYLPPINTAILPTERPEVLKEEVDPEHSCWARRLKAGGLCLVHYVDDLPARTLIPGNPNYGVIFRDKVYLFCSLACRKRFLSRFKKYADADVHFRDTLPPIDIWKLPDLGFLEQTVARMVVRAVKHVGIKRPKIPGLSAAATAAIYIGVFLKIHNQAGEATEVGIYRKVAHCLEACTYIIGMAISGMNIKKDSPAVQPSESDPDRPSQAYRDSTVSTRTMTYIKFRRTSPTQTLIDPDDVTEV